MYECFVSKVRTVKSSFCLQTHEFIVSRNKIYECAYLLRFLLTITKLHDETTQFLILREARA